MKRVENMYIRVGLVIISMIAILHTEVFAQQTIVGVELDDEVELTADEYRGSIQWQMSLERENWSDIDGADQVSTTVLITSLPVFFRAAVMEEGCSVQYSEVIEVLSAEKLRWSDPATWGGTKPVAGEEVIIPAGRQILLDESPPPLGGLMVDGVLEFDRTNLELVSEWIIVNGGILQIGTEEEPFLQNATITLTDTDTEASPMGDMGTRGIMAMTGSLEFHGATPENHWVKLQDHAELNATTLTIDEEEIAGWNVGDEIAIAPTDFYEAANGASVTQRVIIEAISGNEMTINEPLNAFRWGKMQVVTENGMALEGEGTPIEVTEGHITSVYLDERAEIGHLTRNIVIQAPDDQVWQNEGFGVHTMIMPKAQAHIEGVEFRRAGQRGRLRRYAFHWHMLSYEGTETLEDAEGQYYNNNVINTSENRGVVIHGTNGTTVANNVVFDIKGHGIFTEDAAERRNTIDGNLVMKVRNPADEDALKIHESNEEGSSAFWLSNPDNTIVNNIGVDAENFGFWIALPYRTFGASSEVLHSDGLPLQPNRLLFGIFDNNATHSNGSRGIMMDKAEVDDSGEVSGARYNSTVTGRGDTEDVRRRYTLSRCTTWKNRNNGIWDRSDWVDNIGAISADNCGRFFAGAGLDGLIEQSLAVGTSLNHLMNGTDRPENADLHSGIQNATPSAFATYHSTFDIRDNIAVNFPAVAEKGSGVFSLDDYYIRAVEKGQLRNVNNTIINSHPGVKLKSFHGHFSLAGAILDPHGIWGPAGNYLVDDDPFLTYGKTTIPLQDAEIAGGVSVSGIYYGFSGFKLYPNTNPFDDEMPILIRRLNDELEEVGTWSVGPITGLRFLAHHRDFATVPEGLYELTFPDNELPTEFGMFVIAMLEREDTQVVAVQFDGSIDAHVFMDDDIMYAEVNSRQEVIDSTGETYWQDHENNFVWVKVQGGTRELQADVNPISDLALYERTTLSIEPIN